MFQDSTTFLAAGSAWPPLAELHCPFPPAINPATAGVEASTIAWAERHHLLASDMARQHFTQARYALLMGRAYPTADPDVLAVIADWNSWTFLVDNQLDHHTLGIDPQRLSGFASYVDGILRGDAGRDQAWAQVTLLRSLADVADRLRARSTPAWMDRFRRNVWATLDMCVREAHNRQQGHIPTEEAYMEMRPHTSGVFCFLDLIELAERSVLHDDVRYHPAIDRLARLTAEIIFLANDIVSFGKEVAQGDGNNLVIIAQHERRWSLAKALAYVVRRHNAAVEAFQHGRAHLPIVEESQLVERYVSGLEAWIRANIDWSVETGRYRTAPLGARAVNLC